MRAVWLVLVLGLGCGRYEFDKLAASDAPASSTDADMFVPGVISFALGANHTCAVLHDGTLWCWGINTEGNLGTGDTMSRNAPNRVGTESDWVKVAAGGAGSANGYTCGIKGDGSLWCWGTNILGGLGTGGGNTITPQRVGTDRWIWIEAGWLYTCGIQEDRSLWCWGDNTKGTLAQGDTMNRPTPTRVGTRNDWDRVIAALESSCAQTLDGEGFCWGYNQNQQVSTDPKGTYVKLPVPIAGFRWKALAAISRHTCGVRDDGSLWCWGDNSSGQVGLGALDGDHPTPELVSSAADWSAVGGSSGGSLALEGGKLYRWGVMVTAGSFAPALDSTPVTWRAISSGSGGHACAVTIEGRFYCWGDNTDGQIGIGSFGGTVNDPAPVPLPLP